MAEDSRRRNTIIALIVILLLILLLLLRCSRAKPEVPGTDASTPTAPATAAEAQKPTSSEPAAPQPDEVLTPATLKAPERVIAGAVFTVAWTGPDNRGDYVTLVPKEAAANVNGDYKETRVGRSFELTAPVEAGACELRYVTGRSHTILGRAPLEVVPPGVTLDAAAEVTLGAQLSVAWSGPNNAGDYITLVLRETPDGQYGNYTPTNTGSPLSVSAPVVAGDAELRYMTGQGGKVLARRPVRIVMPDVSLLAAADAVAGTTLQVTWTGPNNPGDYVTVVPKETADGLYGNYTVTTSGSPLDLLLPIMAGAAELRYMTGQGNRVLGRRPIEIVAAAITLSAPDEAAAGSAVTITWTGPNNPDDYITVVVSQTPDGEYANYTPTSSGSPLNVIAPKDAGAAELRYMSGQGGKVLARRAIRIVP
jgi:Ca-activated chloride channel family protein